MNYYYDTCIFLHSLNTANKFHAHSRKILSVSEITWIVSFSRDIIISEAPIKEMIDQFEIDCARNGITYYMPTFNDAKRISKVRAQDKKALRKMGFCGTDWSHLCAAIAVSAAALVTNDEDFFDPANKSNPGMHKRSTKVKRWIEYHFPLRILQSNQCPIEP